MATREEQRGGRRITAQLPQETGYLILVEYSVGGRLSEFQYSVTYVVIFSFNLVEYCGGG
jgi:hypothetical protein